MFLPGKITCNVNVKSVFYIDTHLMDNSLVVFTDLKIVYSASGDHNNAAPVQVSYLCLYYLC